MKPQLSQLPKNVRFEADDLEQLIKIASEQDRSVSSLIRLAVKNYIKQYTS
jgi:hypothetical protein